MRFLIKAFMVLAVCLALVGCGKKAGIEGKIVDGKDKPMSGVKLIANQAQPIKGYEHFETKSGSDGTFKFKGVFPSSEYVIEPWSDEWKSVAKVKVQSGPEGQTSMLEKPFMVRYTLSKAGVLADSKTGLQWAPSTGQPMNHYQAEGYVRSLSLDGGGWRLPAIAELKQIHPGHPMLNATSGNWVWSSELCNASGSPGARYFVFDLGVDDCSYRDSSGAPRVLAVRSQK
jgi:hypothetical protein